MDKEDKKKQSAEKAYEIIKKDLNRDTVLGIGTGTTTNYFIEIINNENLDVKGAVWMPYLFLLGAGACWQA